ncbi:SDR family oxidoreductase [Shewanella algidipiscicola]|uniref:NAD(P)-dependent oxidoreductase n=1 Tax=Shewanella algidipiscicola TaxID=614070 RepID=A0ABQ4PFF8_9GAMM|nr:sugar nucleotide-binding protein [Shewanella algidipiscicola]GIU46266.1 NAD(P)-dependent oxidoreductase [Shewanella algidipiscicola]
MEKVLLIGSTGLLGSALSAHLKSSDQYDVYGLSRHSANADIQLDISNTEDALVFFAELEPDYIINLAAITDVEACQRNLDLAYKVNCKIAENVSLYAVNFSKKPVFIVHISTDHFYDGEGDSKENDIVMLNNYAITKYCAEKSLPIEQSVILRTNFLGRSYVSSAASLTDIMYARYHSGSDIKLFNDVFISPLSMKTLCNAISVCLQKKIPGIYNVGSKEGLSKEAIIVNFFRWLGINNFKCESISIDSVPQLTVRPKDMRMDVSAFEKAYNYILPNLNDEIREIAYEYKASDIKCD